MYLQLLVKADLNNIINHFNLTDFYTIVYPATVQYIFFSSAYGVFSKVDQCWNITSLNQFKFTENVQSMCSDN